MGSVIESSWARFFAPGKLRKGTLSASFQLLLQLRCCPGNFSGGLAVLCVCLQPLNLLRTSKRFKSKSGSFIAVVGDGGLGSVSGEKHLCNTTQLIIQQLVMPSR